MKNPAIALFETFLLTSFVTASLASSVAFADLKSEINQCRIGLGIMEGMMAPDFQAPTLSPLLVAHVNDIARDMVVGKDHLLFSYAHLAAYDIVAARLYYTPEINDTVISSNGIKRHQLRLADLSKRLKTDADFHAQFAKELAAEILKFPVTELGRDSKSRQIGNKKLESVSRVINELQDSEEKKAIFTELVSLSLNQMSEVAVTNSFTRRTSAAMGFGKENFINGTTSALGLVTLGTFLNPAIYGPPTGQGLFGVVMVGYMAVTTVGTATVGIAIPNAAKALAELDRNVSAREFMTRLSGRNPYPSFRKSFALRNQEIENRAALRTAKVKDPREIGQTEFDQITNLLNLISENTMARIEVVKEMLTILEKIKSHTELQPRKLDELRNAKTEFDSVAASLAKLAEDVIVFQSQNSAIRRDVVAEIYNLDLVARNSSSPRFEAAVQRKIELTSLMAKLDKIGNELKATQDFLGSMEAKIASADLPLRHLSAPYSPRTNFEKALSNRLFSPIDLITILDLMKALQASTIGLEYMQAAND
jgi:hypothetical protein